MAMYNTDESIRGFAHSSFKMALSKKLPLVSRPIYIITSIYLIFVSLVHVDEEHHS